MLPTIQVFGRTIPMYGLMVVLGLLLGVIIAVIRSKKFNLLKEDVLFASCFAGIGALIGAKFLYIITILPELLTYRQRFIDNPALFLPVLAGGFVFYGGLLGAILGISIYCRMFRLPKLYLLDFIAPILPFIHGFGRLGCNFAGCCYGTIYDGPLHIVLQESNIAPNGVPLLPIQLLESVINFIAASILLIYGNSARRSGKVLGLYLIYYSSFRFLLEYYRGDVIRGFILGLSTSQWISILLLPIGLLLFINPFTRDKRLNNQ